MHHYIHFECPKIFNTLQECKDSFADYEDNHFGPTRGDYYYARYLFNEPVTGNLQTFVLDSLAAMQSHNESSSSSSSSSSESEEDLEEDFKDYSYITENMASKKWTLFKLAPCSDEFHYIHIKDSTAQGCV